MTEAARKLRALSGIQPSGALHLGNYFGAIRQHLELQDQAECFYFIANYHALTTVHDADRLREYTDHVAATYLALGLDPDRVVFFRQSDVPQVCELAWLLMTATGMGLLERAHAYKDKIARGLKPSVGLFCYPVLMAADILAYRSDIVPVGQDQEQHVEMTRDMAVRFHEAYGREVFRLPEARYNETPRVPGTDWERDAAGNFVRDERGRRRPQKMSKSYGNTIPIWAEGKALQRAVARITTDSIPLGEPLDPENCLVFRLCALFLGPAEQAELRELYRSGRIGYKEAKERLVAALDAAFGPYRDRYRALVADRDTLEDVLREGGRKARAEATKTLAAAREACGL